MGHKNRDLTESVVPHLTNISWENNTKIKRRRMRSEDSTRRGGGGGGVIAGIDSGPGLAVAVFTLWYPFVHRRHVAAAAAPAGFAAGGAFHFVTHLSFFFFFFLVNCNIG